MLFTTLFDYFLVIAMERVVAKEKKKILLLVSLTVNLGLLFYFKYSYFFADSTVTLLEHFQIHNDGLKSLISSLKVLMPAGISFYTFQTMSYAIDVYRGEAKAEKNFWRFAGFVSFFPHLVAGPITRHNQLIPPLENIEHHGLKSQYTNGTFLFVLGLAKKILIADQIAMIIDPILLTSFKGGINIPQSMIFLNEPFTAWLLLFGFTFQLYFDFSGYSDMAIGLGRFFGVELPQNFRAPYQALNPSDFWRRWHISLSQWLKDYLYISLGGNRKRKHLNLFLTMVLGGLWHGANWTYVLWGAYHGMILMIHHLLRNQWEKTSSLFQRILTFYLVTLGWMFFRSENIQYAKSWLSTLFDLSNLFTFHWKNLTDTQMFLKLVFLCLIAWFISGHKIIASNFDFVQLNNKKSQKLGIILALVFVITLMLMNNGTKFLYYQF